VRLIDVITSPWAITEDKYLEICKIYATHLRGPKIDIDAVEARLGRPLENDPTAYYISGRVAVIPVQGVIAKRMNMFSRISGGVSTQLLMQQIDDVINNNDDISSAVLDIDSPGGTVDGTFEVSEFIYNARSKKPIVAVIDGLGASAAYSIAAAASRVFIVGDTTYTGSIGVVASHTDYSKQDEMFGVKTTEITAGKYKRITSDTKPLTKEGRAVIQDEVDYLYSLFVGNVAKFRGVSVQTVLDDMADGRLFIGQRGIDAGLVDGVSSLDSIVEQLNDGVSVERLTGALSTSETTRIIEQIESNEDEPMTVKVTKALILDDYPDIAKAFRDEGVASVNVDDIKVTAAQLERDRIKAVSEQSMPGHEKLIQELMFDGKTSGPEAAVKVLQAHKASTAKFAADIDDDAPDPVRHIEPPADAVPSSGINPDQPIEPQCKKAWAANAGNVQDEFLSYEDYLAYTEAHANGQVRRLVNQRGGE